MLANKNRLMILCHLSKGEMRVTDLSEIVGLSQSALSQHLAKLKQEGILMDKKKGQEVYYEIKNHEVEAILATLYLLYCKD
jgi:DNA-binding transcriptional ArsR family regulator